MFFAISPEAPNLEVSRRQNSVKTFAALCKQNPDSANLQTAFPWVPNAGFAGAKTNYHALQGGENCQQPGQFPCFRYPCLTAADGDLQIGHDGDPMYKMRRFFGSKKIPFLPGGRVCRAGVLLAVAFFGSR